MENMPTQKATLSKRIIFGFGSMMFLGWLIGGYILDLINPDMSVRFAGTWLGIFSLVFFLIGFYKVELLENYFSGSLGLRTINNSESELKSPVSGFWILYIILLAIICFVLIFTPWADAVPIIFLIGFVVMVVGVIINKSRNKN